MPQGRSLAIVTACVGVVGMIVVAAGAGLWLSGWPSRWLAEPLLAAALAVMFFWLRDEWREHAGRRSRPNAQRVWLDLLSELRARERRADARRRSAGRRPSTH